MIKKAIMHAGLALLCLFVSFSCKDSITTPDTPPSGILESYQGCKTFQRNTERGAVQHDAAEECIEYDYDGKSVLYVKHINSGFNCCPGKIVADITIVDSAITIEEKETDPSCRCLCLFDVNYKFTNLKPGKYRIRIIGPCTEDDDQILDVTLNLYASSSGYYCIERTHYPWGN